MLVTLQVSVSPYVVFQPQSEYHHKIECETEEMKKCRISSKRFEGVYWANEWINDAPQGPDAHYVDYSSNELGRYFRVVAPAPSDMWT